MQYGPRAPIIFVRTRFIFLKPVMGNVNSIIWFDLNMTLWHFDKYCKTNNLFKVNLRSHFFICWITLHQLKIFRSAFIFNELLVTDVTHANLQLICDEMGKLSFILTQEWSSGKNFLPICFWTTFFYKSQLFRSVGNVIQQKKRCRLRLRPHFVTVHIERYSQGWQI